MTLYLRSIAGPSRGAWRRTSIALSGPVRGERSCATENARRTAGWALFARRRSTGWPWWPATIFCWVWFDSSTICPILIGQLQIRAQMAKQLGKIVQLQKKAFKMYKVFPTWFLHWKLKPSAFSSRDVLLKIEGGLSNQTEYGTTGVCCVKSYVSKRTHVY